MIKDMKLFKAAHAFERAVLQHLDEVDYETRKVTQRFNFGTVAATCTNGEATLWVVFPDNRVEQFELAHAGRRLSWIYHTQPKSPHSTYEVFRIIELWWDLMQWLEGRKDKEAAK